MPTLEKETTAIAKQAKTNRYAMFVMNTIGYLPEEMVEMSSVMKRIEDKTALVKFGKQLTGPVFTGLETAAKLFKSKTIDNKTLKFMGGSDPGEALIASLNKELENYKYFGNSVKGKQMNITYNLLGKKHQAIWELEKTVEENGILASSASLILSKLEYGNPTVYRYKFFQNVLEDMPAFTQFIDDTKALQNCLQKCDKDLSGTRYWENKWWDTAFSRWVINLQILRLTYTALLTLRAEMEKAGAEFKDSDFIDLDTVIQLVGKQTPKASITMFSRNAKVNTEIS